jgi:Ala-tRNA(Pro) deacylase
MGLMNDHENKVQLVIDKDVLAGESFGCHPCINTSSLKFKMKDLLEVVLPEVHHEPIIVDLPRESL